MGFKDPALGAVLSPDQIRSKASSVQRLTWEACTNSEKQELCMNIFQLHDTYMPLCDNEMQHDLFQEKKVLYRYQVEIVALYFFECIFGWITSHLKRREFQRIECDSFYLAFEEDFDAMLSK